MRMEGANDPSRLRISDEDRHRVAELLRNAAGEGRIDFQELDERLEATYAAKTYGDLVPITADLPVHASAPVARGSTSLEPVGSWTSSVAIMSECKREGTWSVPAQHTTLAMMGSVRLDLREAQFAAREVTVYASAVMGDVTVVVNPHTRVVLEGIPIMAEFRESRAKAPAELTADSPTVRVKGFALMGSVSVQRERAPRDSRRRLP